MSDPRCRLRERSLKIRALYEFEHLDGAVVGSSSWHYLVELEGSVEATFAGLRERTFDSGGWLWDPKDEPKKGPKPRSLGEWEQSEYGNDYPGAHSIVDMREIVRDIEFDEIDQGQVLELTEGERVSGFGTVAPSVSDWKRELEAKEKIWDLSDRDSGRYVILTDDPGRRWVAFWGSSGD